MSKKKLVISIIIIAIVLLAVGLGVFLLNKKDSTDKTHKAETTETTEVTEANESTETTAATATTDKPDKASEDASAGDSDDDFETLVANVTDIDMYGDFVLDISDLDLEYGDSINITASGGWTFEAIPFYPQFYGRKGSTVVSDYFHNIVIAGVGTALNKKADVKVGETVKVVKLHGEGAVKRRIMDMGITRGVEVFVRKLAPLGDPIEVNVRDYELSLRKADAEMIEIE